MPCKHHISVPSKAYKPLNPKTLSREIESVYPGSSREVFLKEHPDFQELQARTAWVFGQGGGVLQISVQGVGITA